MIELVRIGLALAILKIRFATRRRGAVDNVDSGEI